MAPRKNAKGGGGHSSSSGSSSSNNSSGTSSPSTGSSGGSSSPGARKDTKHGGHKNGRKGGISGSSFFTWFMVIALLGVWTSVAVVWFDLVDYEEVLGKLGVYDADGDGDFDVDDAKVLLGLKERSASEQAFPPEEAEPHHEPEEKAPGEPEIILEPQNSEAATEEGEEAIFQEMLAMEHDLQQEAEAFLEEPQPGDDDFHTVPENDERAEALESGTFHEASQDHLSQDYSSLDHHPLPDHPSQDDVSQDHPLQEDPSQDHHPLQEDPTQDHPLQDVPPQDDPSKDHVEMMYNQENSEMSPPPVEEQLDTPPDT